MRKGRMMNWYELIPESVATSQIAWERRCSVRRMYAVGLKTKEIAKREGISIARVRQIALRRPDWVSPVELWMKRGGELADFFSKQLHRNVVHVPKIKKPRKRFPWEDLKQYHPKWRIV